MLLKFLIVYLLRIIFKNTNFLDYDKKHFLFVY